MVSAYTVRIVSIICLTAGLVAALLTGHDSVLVMAWLYGVGVLTPLDEYERRKWRRILRKWGERE